VGSSASSSRRRGDLNATGQEPTGNPREAFHRLWGDRLRTRQQPRSWPDLQEDRAGRLVGDPLELGSSCGWPCRRVPRFTTSRQVALHWRSRVATSGRGRRGGVGITVQSARNASIRADARAMRLAARRSRLRVAVDIVDVGRRLSRRLSDMKPRRSNDTSLECAADTLGTPVRCEASPGGRLAPRRVGRRASAAVFYAATNAIMSMTHLMAGSATTAFWVSIARPVGSGSGKLGNAPAARAILHCRADLRSSDRMSGPFRLQRTCASGVGSSLGQLGAYGACLAPIQWIRSAPISSRSPTADGWRPRLRLTQPPVATPSRFGHIIPSGFVPTEEPMTVGVTGIGAGTNARGCCQFHRRSIPR